MLQANFAFTHADSIITDSDLSSFITVVTPNGRTQRLTGTFFFDSAGNLDGADIRGMEEYTTELIYTISEFSMDHITWANFVLNNNAAGQREYLFRGNDIITGSSKNDTLKGFRGHDFIDGGGGGGDVAVFSGPRSNYTITISNGQLVVRDRRGSDGTDTLVHVEKLKFGSAAAVIANAGPVVNASAITPGHVQSFVTFSGRVTFSDPERHAVTEIRVYDGTLGNGQFRLNGSLLNEGVTHTLTPADFASLEFTTHATGANVVQMQAYDGYSWGAWKTFTVNPRANAGPVVTVINLTPGKNDLSIASEDLFDAIDPDGDPVTEYRFYDATPGNGNFVISGTPHLTNTNFTATDLNTVTFETSGTGSDLLWVQASDGIGWGAWKSFTVNARQNAAPTVTVLNRHPAHGELSIAADDLFNVVDNDGDTPAQYRFYDGTPGANGNFVVNGTPWLANSNFIVNHADLATITFATSTTGSDRLWIQIHDGTTWGAWQSFTVDPIPNAAPTVIVLNEHPEHGELSIAADALFNVSDSDGDVPAQYRFYDGTPGANGHFVVNGTPHLTNTNFVVDHADLATVSFATSTSGPDRLWVQVHDGTEWGAWQSFTINAIPNAAPTITLLNKQPAVGDLSIPLDDFFDMVDDDLDAITQYRFFDGTAGNGNFVVSGTPWLVNQNFIVDHDDLATVTFATSTTGSDRLWVQAHDGTEWGAWMSFTVGARPASSSSGGGFQLVIFDPGAGFNVVDEATTTQTLDIMASQIAAAQSLSAATTSVGGGNALWSEQQQYTTLLAPT